MEEILRKLLEMTLYGSIAVALVLLFRVVFRKIPKKITTVFWVAAAIRLLCPFNFSMRFGLMNLFEKKAPNLNPSKVPVSGQVYIPRIASGNAPKITAAASKEISEVANNNNGFSIPISAILITFWVIGVLAILGVLIYKTIRLQKLIGKGRKTGDTIESDMIETPFVVGFLRPVVVLPTFLDSSEKEYLIMHEQVHIKNRDNLIRALGLVIVCIHWFNPLVWIAFNILCNDLEMRVDEEVIDNIGTDIKKDYCLSIVNHASKSPRYKVYGASFAKKTLSGMEVKMRIKNLIKYKNVPTIVGVAVVVATLGMTTVLSSCAKEKTEEVINSVTSSELTIAGKNETEPSFSENDWSAPWSDESTIFISEEEELDSLIVLSTTKFQNNESDTYLRDYGEVNEITYSEWLQLKEEAVVEPDYYEGSDFVSYAEWYSGHGYTLYDIEKMYSNYGGVYFKEGFIGENGVSGPVLVVRTDRNLLLEYIANDLEPEDISYKTCVPSASDWSGHIFTAIIDEKIGNDSDYEFYINVFFEDTDSINIATLEYEYPE